MRMKRSFRWKKARASWRFQGRILISGKKKTAKSGRSVQISASLESGANLRSSLFHIEEAANLFQLGVVGLVEFEEREGKRD